MISGMSNPDSSAAWHELLSAFADFDKLFLDGPRAVRGDLAEILIHEINERYGN